MTSRVNDNSINSDDGQSKVEYETVCCCCVVEKPSQVITTVDAEKAIQNIKQDEIVFMNLDVFISTLDKCHQEGIHVVSDYGFITANNCTRKVFDGNLLTSVAIASETARSLALANLRLKAKSIGANAVLGLKLDIENDDLGRAKFTNVVAMGTAVKLNSLPYDMNSTHYKYSSPPYMALMTRD